MLHTFPVAPRTTQGRVASNRMTRAARALAPRASSGLSETLAVGLGLAPRI